MRYGIGYLFVAGLYWLNSQVFSLKYLVLRHKYYGRWGLIFIFALLSGCGSGSSESASGSNDHSDVESISVSPASLILTPDKPTAILEVQVIRTDGSSTTEPVTWSSSNPTIGSVDASNIVQTHGTVGSATLTAEFGSVISNPIKLLFAELNNGVTLLDSTTTVSAVDISSLTGQIGEPFVVSLPSTVSVEIGQYLVGHDGLPFAGQVTEITPVGNDQQISLQFVGLGDVFRNFDFVDVSPLSPSNIILTEEEQDLFSISEPGPDGREIRVKSCFLLSVKNHVIKQRCTV